MRFRDCCLDADSAGFFQVIVAEKDARRICGLPPAYTLLEAVRPNSGKLLHYDQYVHPRGYESVSFASMAFHASEPPMNATDADVAAPA